MNYVYKPAVLIASILGWTIGQCPVLAQDNSELKWKWAAGDKLEMVIAQDLSSTMRVEGEEKTSKNKTTTWVSWEVQSVNDRGTATINSVVDRITMDSEGPDGKVSYDSANGEKEMDEAARKTTFRVAPMVGAETTQKISSLGEVQMVAVGAELEKKLRQIGGNAYVNLFKDMSRNATIVFPRDGLEVGKSWDKQIRMATPMGSLNLMTTYTYQGEQTVDSRPLHQFDVAVKMSFANDAVTVDEQDTSGVIYFDAVAGRIDHSRVEQAIRISVSMGGQKGTQSLSQVTTVNIRSK